MEHYLSDEQIKLREKARDLAENKITKRAAYPE